MPDPDALARRAYEAFYAALDGTHQPWGWAHLRPQVQAAWRVVVAVVREGEAREGGREAMTQPSRVTLATRGWP